MNNRTAAKIIFKYLKSIGFTATDIEFGDGYFVFTLGDDGVTHFHIKGLRGWKFGMWINTDVKSLRKDNGTYYPIISFFCQHEDNLDKFKPSRSFFHVNISPQQFKDYITNEDVYALNDIGIIVRHIKHNPILAYVEDCYNWFSMQDTDVITALLTDNYRKEYFKIKANFVKRKCKKLCEDIIPILTQKTKIPFLEKFDIVDYVEFEDHNRNGFICSPRYDMGIHFKKLYDIEEKQEDAETEVLYKMFKKNLCSYDNVSISCYRDWEGVCPYDYTLYENKR